jgi:hypothetical protein
MASCHGLPDLSSKISGEVGFLLVVLQLLRSKLGTMTRADDSFNKVVMCGYLSVCGAWVMSRVFRLAEAARERSKGSASFYALAWVGEKICKWRGLDVVSCTGDVLTASSPPRTLAVGQPPQSLGSFSSATL